MSSSFFFVCVLLCFILVPFLSSNFRNKIIRLLMKWLTIINLVNFDIKAKQSHLNRLNMNLRLIHIFIKKSLRFKNFNFLINVQLSVIWIVILLEKHAPILTSRDVAMGLMLHNDS